MKTSTQASALENRQGLLQTIHTYGLRCAVPGALLSVPIGAYMGYAMRGIVGVSLVAPVLIPLAASGGGILFGSTVYKLTALEEQEKPGNLYAALASSVVGAGLGNVCARIALTPLPTLTATAGGLSVGLLSGAAIGYAGGAIYGAYRYLNAHHEENHPKGAAPVAAISPATSKSVLGNLGVPWTPQLISAPLVVPAI